MNTVRLPKPKGSKVSVWIQSLYKKETKTNKNKLSIKVSSLVLLLDKKEKREGEKDTWCQHIVQPLRPNLRNF